MSSRNTTLLSAVLAVSGLVASAAAAQELPPVAWTPPALTGKETVLPVGRDIIQRMTEFMTGSEVLLTETLVTYESVQESGQKLHFDLLQAGGCSQTGPTVLDDPAG